MFANRLNGEEGRFGDLPPLKNKDFSGEVVTRFAPNPDFVLHLGSIRAAILSHDYARKYDGRFLLRFEDTDPRLKKSALEYYDAIRDDLKWLECPWDQEWIQSDRLSLYYEHAVKLLDQGSAYVCTCEREAFSARISRGEPCPCRLKDPTTNLDDWRKMLHGGYSEGEAVVRIKTDITHPNPAVRDWPAFRVIDPEKYPHPRVGTKYRVWPLYNIASAIDDHLLGVTHIFRGKEHLTNAFRQGYVYKYLEWKYPEAIHYGRLKAVGFTLSKSVMVKQLETGEVKDYSDPRLPTLAALRRRGYSPNTLRKIVHEMGPRPVDATLSWDNINAADRKEVDRIAHRYNFLVDPVPLDVTGVPGNFEAHLPLHPGQPELGARTLKVNAEGNKARVWLSGADKGLLATSKVLRLMELFNVEVENADASPASARFHSQDYMTARKLGAPLIQWLPEGQRIQFQSVMPDATLATGQAEENVLAEPVGSIIQMVRFGFARIDFKDKSQVEVYYSHR
ncbi:glutamate--tRNA ligase [archaeon 13_1_20CM_2_54_9]|nr:MAG: glutamate--tRNA ligase [archaeon 13_1_20CM_2_54_9]